MGEPTELINQSANEPSIIAITKVKPKNARFTPPLAELGIPGYNIHHNGIGDRKGRGIIIYVDRDIETNEINSSTTFEESLWAECKTSKEAILVGTVYRSPNSPHENNTRLNDLIQEMEKKKYQHTITMVDFNYLNVTGKITQELCNKK